MVVFAVEGVCEIGKMTYELSDLWKIERLG